MPDITPSTPGGALPPKPAEAAKVQPKKETVRINLPPKPTSAPTIKLPTLAHGAPAPVAAPAAAAPRAAAPPAPPSAHAAPAAAPAPRAAAPAAAPSRAPAQAAAQRPSAPVQMVAGVPKMDKILAIAAAVVGLAAVGITLYLAFGIPTGTQ